MSIPIATARPPQEDACNAKKLDETNKSKVKALIFDRLLYRHWNAYKAGKRTHMFVVDANSSPSFRKGVGFVPLYVSYRDLTPGDYDAPEFSLGGQDDYAFSPDGQEICYTSNHDKVEATSTNNDLWTVPVNWPANATPTDVLAKTKNITADNPASDSTPLYSPDGKYIAYRAQQRPGYESDRFRLMLYDRKTEKTTNLMENFDGWVGSFAWDRHDILFTAENEGESPIYMITPEICLERCHPIKFVDGYNDDIAISRTTPEPYKDVTIWEPITLFTQMSLHAPTEIFIATPGSWSIGTDKLKAMLLGESKEPLPQRANPRVRQLTHLNDAVLSQVAMSPLESFRFEGANDDKVEGFLVKPPNFDASKKYPVKFLIHGGPQGAWGDDWSYRWNPELFAALTLWPRIRGHHDQLPRLDRIRTEVR